MGAFLYNDRVRIEQDLESVLQRFPRLRERRKQLGGTLSGGEQQMLAIARALMARPTLLLLDEPSMGLSPILVEQIFEIIRDINSQGTSILLVEQNAQMALSIADRGYVLETGRVVLEGPGPRTPHKPDGDRSLPGRTLGERQKSDMSQFTRILLFFVLPHIGHCLLSPFHIGESGLSPCWWSLPCSSDWVS